MQCGAAAILKGGGWRGVAPWSPRWSPDGSRLAFSATGEEGDAQTHLYLLDGASGSVRQLGDAEVQMADPESVRWLADARALCCTLARFGRHQVAKVGIACGRYSCQATGTLAASHASDTLTATWQLSCLPASRNTGVPRQPSVGPAWESRCRG